MPTASIDSILAPDGAIARRLGAQYEARPQQLEMAHAVEEAFAQKHHLLVEAGTGVGKSFAYLLPAIDYAVKHKKRVVISTHTISLQEQLIEKDIPLIQSVYPDEFTAVLVKGRSNYLCQRRLEQARGRQNFLFEQESQLESLWAIEEWCQHSLEDRGIGSLAELPQLPDPSVWERVCAEQGNCLGKKCKHYNNCFWQAAKRRMQSGNILVVNHALFFSDLGLRMAGVNYLPKYDLVILDEAHTVEDVAAQHFGVRISESSIRYNLRSLYDVKRGRGMLSVHGGLANDAIQSVIEINDACERFFERIIGWQESQGRANGRVHEKDVVENDLSPRLEVLAKRLRSMGSALLTEADEDSMEARSRAEAEASELGAMADKVQGMGDAVTSIVSQTVENAVYWFEVSGRTPKRVSLHAAPVNVAEGLKQQLFELVPSVVMTSATLCAGSSGVGFQPARKKTHALHAHPAETNSNAILRRSHCLPHLTATGSVYAITFRLADSMPQEVLDEWRRERDELTRAAREQTRPLSHDEAMRLDQLHSARIDHYLDAGRGECWLADPQVAECVAAAIKHFDGQRYELLGWTVMPNHAHLILQPYESHALADVMHSIKSYSANCANRLLKRCGEFWQSEYYDHLVRDEDDLRNQVEYAWANPDAAELEDWRWRGRDELKIAAVINADPWVARGRVDDTARGVEAHATEEQPAASREQLIVPPAFAYIASRLGVANCRTLQLGSPFDYAKQATLYVESGLPEPSDTNRFLPAACDRIIHYLKQTNGGAFVLFTSYKMLIDAANRLKNQIDDLGLPLLVQGQGGPRKVLLDRFRGAENAVLFGTSSFWQGIDVQGEKLRNVIIVKLPFDVPDEPVIEARLEAITRRGGNAFMELSVPQAVIKLKQGFGRLIRSKTDTGIVAILDSRVKTKRYGKMFIQALPPCRVVEVGGKSSRSAESQE